VDASVDLPSSSRSPGFRYAEASAVQAAPGASPAGQLKTIPPRNFVRLDGLIAGRKFVGGHRFTLADIHLFVF
jgi:glutathione S-transferase